jgi:hypothetical protein
LQRRWQQKQQRQPPLALQLPVLQASAAGLRQAVVRLQQPGGVPASLPQVLKVALHQQTQRSQAAVNTPAAAAAAEGQLAVPLRLVFLHSVEEQQQLLLALTRWRLCLLVAAALFAAGC